MMKNTDKLLLAVSVVVLLIIPFLIPIPSTPDQARYMYLLSGAYTGEPCPEVVFVGYLFGVLCSWLYSISTGIEWYSVILYASHLLSYIVVTFYVLRWKPNLVYVKYVVFFLLLLLFVYLLLILQYTILATELAFASLVTMIQADSSKKKQLFGIILFFIATQLRLEAAFIPYMIACPIFLNNFRWNDILWWKKLLPLLGLIVVACITFFSNKSAYSDDMWKDFNEYNEARGFLADNPFAGELTSTIVNQEDRLAYDLFYRYRIFDQNILTLEKIKAYQQEYERKRLEVIRDNVRSYMNVYKAMGGGWVLLVLLWSFFELLRKKKFCVILQFVMVIALFTAANMYMMSNSFPKERVLFGSMTALFFAVIYITRNYVRHIEALLILVCLFWGYRYIMLDYSTSRLLLSRNHEVKEVEQMLADSPSKKVMLPVRTQIAPEIFHTSSSIIGRKGVIQGWIHIYPKADLSYQPFTAFLNGLPILVKKDAVEQVEMIQQLIYLHYAIPSKQNVIKESQNYLLIKLSCNEV